MTPDTLFFDGRSLGQASWNQQKNTNCSIKPIFFKVVNLKAIDGRFYQFLTNTYFVSTEKKTATYIGTYPFWTWKRYFMEKI